MVIGPPAASARSCCQTAGPAMPSVFMLCWDSKAITAPLVIWLGVPTVHRLDQRGRLVPAPGERALLGLGRLLGGGQRPGRGEADRQVAELGQQLLEAEGASLRHGEVGRVAGWVRFFPVALVTPPATGGDGHRLGRRRHQGGGGDEGEGVGRDQLPHPGDGRTEGRGRGVGAEGLGELHRDGCVARHLGRPVGGARSPTRNGPVVGGQADLVGWRRRRGRRGPVRIAPHGDRGDTHADHGHRHQGDGEQPAPVSGGRRFRARCAFCECACRPYPLLDQAIYQPYGAVSAATGWTPVPASGGLQSPVSCRRRSADPGRLIVASTVSIRPASVTLPPSGPRT